MIYPKHMNTKKKMINNYITNDQCMDYTKNKNINDKSWSKMQMIVHE